MLARNALRLSKAWRRLQEDIAKGLHHGRGDRHRRLRAQVGASTEKAQADKQGERFHHIIP
jgi:hypothetical protein